MKHTTSFSLVLFLAVSCTTRRPPPAAPVPPPDLLLYRQALALQKEGRLAEAGTAWEDLLARYPETPRAADALFWLAFDQEAAAHPREALATLGKLVARFPTGPLTPAALLKASQIHWLCGAEPNLAHARQELEEITARFPQNPLALEARLGLARRFEEEGRVEEALSLYASLESDAGLSAEDREPLARWRSRLSRFHEANAELAARLSRAQGHLLKGFPSEALAEFEHLLAGSPPPGIAEEAVYHAGLALALLGRYEASAKHFEMLSKSAADADLKESALHNLERLPLSGTGPSRSPRAH